MRHSKTPTSCGWPAGSAVAFAAMPKPTIFPGSTVRQGSASTTLPKNIWPRRRSARACFWSWSLGRRHRCGISAQSATSRERSPCRMSTTNSRPGVGASDHKINGHPPFPAQVILNGHEYVACQAHQAGITFTKEGNCFTAISDAAGLAKIADTLSENRAIGRLSQVCERWIYTCVCFALDFDEQKRSGFRYQYSNYQIEYSRNLVFHVGGHMDQVFQALIDRSRAPLDLQTIKTILGYKHRPKYRRPTKRPAEWEVAVERPTYDL